MTKSLFRCLALAVSLGFLDRNATGAEDAPIQGVYQLDADHYIQTLENVLGPFPGLESGGEDEIRAFLKEQDLRWIIQGTNVYTTVMQSGQKRVDRVGGIVLRQGCFFLVEKPSGGGKTLLACYLDGKGYLYIGLPCRFVRTPDPIPKAEELVVTPRPKGPVKMKGIYGPRSDGQKSKEQP